LTTDTVLAAVALVVAGLIAWRDHKQNERLANLERATAADVSQRQIREERLLDLLNTVREESDRRLLAFCRWLSYLDVIVSFTTMMVEAPTVTDPQPGQNLIDRDALAENWLTTSIPKAAEMYEQAEPGIVLDQLESVSNHLLLSGDVLESARDVVRGVWVKWAEIQNLQQRGHYNSDELGDKIARIGDFSVLTRAGAFFDELRKAISAAYLSTLTNTDPATLATRSGRYLAFADGSWALRADPMTVALSEPQRNDA
jgi:hypothetical protein